MAAGTEGGEAGTAIGGDPNRVASAGGGRPRSPTDGARCVLRLGTRGSALARTQTERVIALLAARVPGVDAEPVVIRTEGDVDKTSPLTLIGGRGVFTSALQEALLRGELEAAVHSAKDLPSEQPAGLVLAAFPEREDPRDVLVSRHGLPLAELPPRPTVGTSSRRRAVQTLRRRPDARIVELRGNVDSRLRKALETEVDAIVLAAAGVRRMGWAELVTEELSLDTFVPSPGQGALAVETRTDDAALRSCLGAIDDPRVSGAVRVERAFLRAVGGGCTTPLGAHVALEGDRLRLRAMIASEDGERVEWADEWLEAAEAEARAAEVAVRLLARVRAAGGTTFGFHPSVAMPTGNGVGAGAPPLAGLSVLVTRARAQAEGLAGALREQGAESVLLPTIRIAAPSDARPLDAAMDRLRTGAFDWVVFTSANAVARLLGRLSEQGADGGALSGTRIAAVGEATAATLRDAGVRVDLVPHRADAEGLVAALVERGIAGCRVLYPKAERARDAVPDGLRAHGTEVEAVDAYRTVPETDADPAVVERLVDGGVDVVTFASPSSVRNLWALLGDRFSAVGRAEVVCVGPVTAAAAREMGLPVRIVAEDASVTGIVEALVRSRAGGEDREGAGRPPVAVEGTENVLVGVVPW